MHKKALFHISFSSILILLCLSFFHCSPSPVTEQEQVSEHPLQDAAQTPEPSAVESGQEHQAEPRLPEKKPIQETKVESSEPSTHEPTLPEPLPERELCQPNPCKQPNQNICEVRGDKVVCLCNKGFQMQNGKCVPLNPCSPNPCKQPNKSRCTAQGTSYTCACDPGYKDNNGRCVKEHVGNCNDFYRSALSLRDTALKNRLFTLSGQNYHKMPYSDSREKVFLSIDNVKGKVMCVYTGRWTTAKTKIPKNNDMNIEHTWPRSQGAVGAAEADMHHLFPSDARTNSARGSYPFGAPVTSIQRYGPTSYQSRRGKNASGKIVFEVATQHRGDVARAMFYFAIRYKKSIDATQEKTLRQWHSQDPVNSEELSRSQRIQKIQKNRNPFIDCPQFVGQIKDF